MAIREYKPYRINHPFSVPSKDRASLERDFPNGVITKKGKQFIASYKYPMVVDRPSVGEIAIFNHKRKKIKYAVLIPQDSRGFDTRTSGLARSVKTSKAARKKSMQAIAMDKHTASMNLPKTIPSQPPKPAIPKDVVFSPPLKKEDEAPKIKSEPAPKPASAFDIDREMDKSVQKLVDDVERKTKEDLDSKLKEKEVKQPRRSYSRRKTKIKPEPETDKKSGEAKDYNNTRTSETEEK